MGLICEWAMLKKKNCRSLARDISHGDKFGNLICEWAMLKKKNCRSLARGISHGDKFGNLIGTCGRVAADKSDNVWHWHQACEWAMLKKNCRSLARGISHGDKFGNLKKKLQKFGTGYFARGQIREPHRYLRQGCNRQKRQCMALAPGM